MPVRLCRAILVVACFFALTGAQCQNELAIWNPDLRTQTGNNIWFLVPVEKRKAMDAVNEAFPSNKLTGALTLLDISSIPGVPAGLVSKNQHLISIQHGAIGDTRQSILQLGDDLLGSQTMVPFVGYKGGKRPFIAPLIGYIGGKKKDEILNKLQLLGIVPALVSSLIEGITLLLGTFLPEDKAWECNGAGECYANSKRLIFPNSVSGPGVIIEAVDVTFRNATSTAYPLTFWSDVINQPLILKTLPKLFGLCQRNSYFFNETSAHVQYQSGEARLYAGAGGAGLKTGVLKGEYRDLHGISGCTQNVGFAPQPCADLAQ